MPTRAHTFAGDDADATTTKRKGCRWWLWGWLLLIVGVPALMLMPDDGKSRAPRLNVGDECMVGPDGGAWFATTDAAWDEMLDAQVAKSGPLLGRLVSQGKAFREPAGSKVLVVKTSIFAAWCRVTEGANVGDEGWTHAERLTPLR